MLAPCHNSLQTKPIHKFAVEILEELSKGYHVIYQYHTQQKIIKSVEVSSEEDEATKAQHK